MFFSPCRNSTGKVSMVSFTLMASAGKAKSKLRATVAGLTDVAAGTVATLTVTKKAAPGGTAGKCVSTKKLA